jgi:hypothetical protein
VSVTALAADASVVLKWVFPDVEAHVGQAPAVLVTADEQYYHRAVGAGRVTLLSDYTGSSSSSGTAT